MASTLSDARARDLPDGYHEFALYRAQDQTASETLHNADTKQGVDQSCLRQSPLATGRVRSVGCCRGYCTCHPDPRPPAAHPRNTNKRSRSDERACSDLDAHSRPRTELLTRPSGAASPHAMPCLSSRTKYPTRRTTGGGAQCLVSAAPSGSMSRACTRHGM